MSDISIADVDSEKDRTAQAPPRHVPIADIDSEKTGQRKRPIRPTSTPLSLHETLSHLIFDGSKG